MEYFVSTNTGYGYRSYRFESEARMTDYLGKELKALSREGFDITSTQQGPRRTDYVLRNENDDVVEVRVQEVA